MMFFLKLKRNYLSKMHGYPIFSFWIPMVLTKITVFESITNKKTRVSRDAQSVCAITIVGTALNATGLNSYFS